ncbi:Lar family restriction alleviation protein [Citrobacter sp. MGH106]|uniref:Lar family restriction alleviation protein n=1 Tax=Citrobacter sp. MGH106 TaxID=1686381 RepID=UPI000650A041|nr:Lar family restriction alleviation protein [Citrobacter sp. MGH106]KLV66909.1 hypothetical protein SK36_01628 [Citrobacter sp. MGH106]
MTTNHPAHGPVSLDRLHQIREILSKAAAQSDGGNLGYAMADAVKVIDGVMAAFGAKLDENGLLPCPLCGGGAEFDYDDDNLNWISCSVCGISTDTVYHTDIDARDKLREVWNRRAAMLQAGNSLVTHDGYVLVPKKLTAENGAKSVLTGEFSETKFINCPECFGDDECETCDGSGRIEITVPVSWTNIKAIWAKGVEHFEAAPQQENI